MSVSAAALFNRPPPAGAKKAARKIAPVLVTPLPAAPQGGTEQPHLAPKSANLTGPSSQFGQNGGGMTGQLNTGKAIKHIETKVIAAKGDRIKMAEVPEDVWKKLDDERSTRMKKLAEAEDNFVRNTNEADELAKERKALARKKKKAETKQTEQAAPSAVQKMPEKILKDGKCYKLVKPYYREDKTCGVKPAPKPRAQGTRKRSATRSILKGNLAPKVKAQKKRKVIQPKPVANGVVHKGNKMTIVGY
jgi:hypothetical protein